MNQENNEGLEIGMIVQCSFKESKDSFGRQNISNVDWVRLNQRCSKIKTNDTHNEGIIAARERLEILGEVIKSGGYMPDEARHWLGSALIEIANINPSNKSDGATYFPSPLDANKVLGLKKPRAQPIKLRNKLFQAAEMTYLTHHGLSQFESAGIVANNHDKSDEQSIIKDHNLFKKMSYPFEGFIVKEINFESVTTEAPGEYTRHDMRHLRTCSRSFEQ